MYSKEEAREHRARLAKFEQKVKRYELICNSAPSQKNIDDLEAAKYEYELLYDYMVRGCHCNFSPADLPDGLPSFYRECFYSLVQINC